MAEKIGFIGLGAMGSGMSRNLIKKGYQLTVCDLIEERVQTLVDLGAQAAKTPKEVARQSDVIITIVQSSPQVREAVLGPNGVIEGGRKGQIYIDMSTIDPVTTKEVAETLSGKGIRMLDAPVARGVPAATAGTLVIFVGGEKEVFDQCNDILSAMGTDIYYCGGTGTGEVVKLVNNFMVATTTCALAEALVLGAKAGVEADVLCEALSDGSGNSYVLQNHYKKNALKGLFKKGVFPVNYMLKDLDLALTTGKNYNVPLYFGALATQAYESARAAGYEEEYHPVVIRALEDLTGVQVRFKNQDDQ
jgi:3-hydroxyisobutyrate dehydrogenase-like beta-hydroxyacid dehydrogenase